MLDVCNTPLPTEMMHIKRMGAMKFTFTSCANKSIEELAEAFNNAFIGYILPLNMNVESFGDYLRTFQVDVVRSIISYGSDSAFSGCGLLAIRGQRGWVGGFGVAPAFRRTGLSVQLLDKLIEQAQQLRLNSLSLEVLQVNERALRLYLKRGFKVTRNLIMYEALAAAVEEFAPVGLLNEEEEELEPGVALATFGMPEQNGSSLPCWQRETPSVLGQRGVRARLGRLASGEQMLLLFLPISSIRKIILLHVGFDTAMAEEKQLALLAGLLHSAALDFGPPQAQAHAANFAVMNEPENSCLTVLLQKLGFKEVWRQYEMLLKL